MPRRRQPAPQLRRLRTALALWTLAIVAFLGGPGTASASCRMPPPLAEAIKEAEIVFVGTVVATANVERTATVSVEEVWKGPAMPAMVQVKGGGDDPNTASSVDRSFQSGARYVFLPQVAQNGSFVDNSCSNTEVWDDSMAVFRPADARLGEVDVRDDLRPIDLGFVVGIGGVLLVVAAVMLGVGLLARGRSD